MRRIRKDLGDSLQIAYSGAVHHVDRCIERAMISMGIESSWAHRHVQQLYKFIVTGLLNLGFDILLFSLFVDVFGLSVVVGGSCSSIIVICVVFVMNKYWTFRKFDQDYVQQSVRFIILYSSSFILVNVLTWFFADVILLWHIFARLIAIAICAVWNYSWLHFAVFPHSSKVTTIKSSLSDIS